MEPKPENVDGTKVVKHSVSHRIDWGYVALGAGLLAVAWTGYRVFVDTGDDESGASGGI